MDHMHFLLTQMQYHSQKVQNMILPNAEEPWRNFM